MVMAMPASASPASSVLLLVRSFHTAPEMVPGISPKLLAEEPPVGTLLTVMTLPAAPPVATPLVPGTVRPLP